MSTNPAVLSLSASYELRWNGISYLSEGVLVDPRHRYLVEFQLLAPGVETFGDWTAGTWDANTSTPTGPFAATVIIGAGQPAPVNPGVAGLYTLWGRFAGTSENPVFAVTSITLAAP